MPHTDVIPTSASTASVGKGIRYIGSRAYAYSGQFGASNTEFIMLDFTTGSGYIDGEFTLNAAVRIDLVDVGSVCAFSIKFNGEVISKVKIDTNDKDMQSQGYQRVIIPPLTRVIVSANTNENTDNEKLTVTFGGRVYGDA